MNNFLVTFWLYNSICFITYDFLAYLLHGGFASEKTPENVKFLFEKSADRWIPFTTSQ